MKRFLNYLHVLKSKTIFFFGIIGSFLLENAQETIGYIQQAMPQLQEYLPANPYKTLGFVLIIGGIVLRVATKAPLSDKLPTKKESE